MCKIYNLHIFYSSGIKKTNRTEIHENCSNQKQKLVSEETREKNQKNNTQSATVAEMPAVSNGRVVIVVVVMPIVVKKASTERIQNIDFVGRHQCSVYERKR